MQRVIRFWMAVVLVVQATICLSDTTDLQKTDALFAALGVPELLAIMRVEGLDHGADIGEQVLGDRNNPAWDALVATIYDPDFMIQDIRAAFDEELQGCDLDAMLAFFRTQPGQSIVSLEISARRALLDANVDAQARMDAMRARRDGTPRVALIGEIMQANNLVDGNVAGALNANYAFTMALLDGGALPSNVTADTVLTQVWADEPDIRRDTTDWLYAHLLLALQPLSDDDLATYLAFSRSAAGQDLNAALSVAFDGLFSDISRALGRGSARFLVSERL